MPDKQETIKIINDALQSDNKNVIVLKGKWGIGKTYLWNKIAEMNDKHSVFDLCHKLHWLCSSKVRAKKEYKSGYVSLFGKRNFEEIVQEAILSIYFKNKPRNILERILIKTKSFWFKLVGIPNFQAITQSFSAIFALLGINSLKRTILCFDDIERMDKNIEFKEFLGFVNNLVEHEKCKVILIFNENELFNIKEDIINEEDNGENTNNTNKIKNENSEMTKQEIYNKYKEKIIDIEVEYSPTFKDNFTIASRITFYDIERKYIDEVSNTLQELKENNIRIIKKCIESVNDFIVALDKIKDKVKYYDKFVDLILPDIIKSITFITQQYWKEGHRFWDSSYIENNIKPINKNLNENNDLYDLYFQYVYGGNYLLLFNKYFQGYVIDSKMLYKYLKNYDTLVVYNIFRKKINGYGSLFWGNVDSKIEDYVNDMCSLLEDEETVYSIFINMSYPELQSFIFDNNMLKDNDKFKEIFYKQMNTAIDRYIEEYRNNFDIEYNYDMLEKISFIQKDKMKLLYRIPQNIGDYRNILSNIARDINSESDIYLINQLDYNTYKSMCEEDGNFYNFTVNLFFRRNSYKIGAISKEKEISHFLYIVANYMLNAIKINPDNEIKYKITANLYNKNKDYNVKEDLEQFISLYSNSKV